MNVTERRREHRYRRTLRYERRCELGRERRREPD
jgi:hypothetical protein